MRPARRAAAALVLAAGGGLLAGPAAGAEDLGPAWEGEVGDGGPGVGSHVSGEQLVVPVTFRYAGLPGSVVTELALLLESVDGRCEDHEVVQPLAEGDGGGSGLLDPADATGPAVAEWTFVVDPGCNGTFDLEVVGTADPRGPARPGDPGTVSAPLVVHGLRLSLVPPPPEDVAVEAAPDRTVTVRWSPPTAWRDGAPPDAVGYRVERALGAGVFAPVGTVGVEQASYLDPELVAAPAGTYRYRVVTLREGADGDPVASATAAEGATELGPQPMPTTSAPPGGAGGGAVPRAASPGVPAPAPVPEFDAGYSETLDYGQELGAPDAVPPAGANLLDVSDAGDEAPVGAGILVPAAVASCVAVWALHVRHLVRRATPTT